MEDKKFTKLSALVGQTFTVHSVPGYKFKKWDPDNKKMEMSDSYVDGYAKKWQLETDKGTLDLSASQLGSCLESAFYQGQSDLRNKTFEVKSNGKTGMDIRYYFNFKKEAPLTAKADDQPPLVNYDELF